MRVLQVNKFLYPVGGSETALFETSRLLQSHGHEVVSFGMQDERNLSETPSKQLVSRIDLRVGGGITEILRPRRLLEAGRLLHSREAAGKIDALIEATRPDVAHLHNIYHQLSPSILGPLRRHGVPTVLTLHDYKLICPNYTLFSGGSVCERCKGHDYWHAVEQGCVKGSRAQSLLCAVEAYAHHATRTYERGIDTFIAPSRFMRDKVIEFGFEPDQVVHLPNFLDLEAFEPSYEPGSYAVYAGRIERVKGVSTLLEAWRHCQVEGPFGLRLAGDGELLDALRLQAPAGASFLGRLAKPDLMELVRGAAFVVVPSEWYENAPMNVLEAYACGKPVIGARIGGIPELVEEGQTGLLFEPGNVAQLQQRIEYLAERPGLAIEMGRKARARVERLHSPSRHLDALLAVYERAAVARGKQIQLSKETQPL
jgi:glycosyltransferase involved in cell wall biosynthesis